MPERPICIIEAKNILAECPVWHPDEQALYWTDITGRLLQRFTPATGTYRKWDLPDEFGSFAFRADGQGIIAGTRDGFCFFDPKTGLTELLDQPEHAFASNRMNDGKCDPEGRFWCGSIHEVSDPADRQAVASMYRVGPNGEAVKMRGQIKTSNGFAWSPDGRRMYFTDTPTLDILVFDYDPHSGEISNERVFARIETGHGRPDGACVDIDGCLWSAHFSGGKITRYSPQGEVLETIALPVSNVTSCAFGGEDLSTLYVTTAREDMTEVDLRREPLAGGIFALQTDTRGVPIARYCGSPAR